LLFIAIISTLKVVLELCTLSKEYNILLSFLLPVTVNTVITVIYLIFFSHWFSYYFNFCSFRLSGEKKVSCV